MIHEIAPYQLDNTYCRKMMEDNDVVMIFIEDQVILKETGDSLALLTAAEYKAITGVSKMNAQYLFKIDNTAYYWLNLTKEQREKIEQSEQLGLHPLSVFRSMEPRHEAFAGITASQLYRFYQSHQFCGCCGHTMHHSETERAMICDSCKKIIYPNIAPAIIVAITDGKRLLMTRYARGEYKRYALVAGYCEVGESLEETVHREVMEEVGLKVKNVRYYNSQPWPFSDTMMVGFLAELDGSDQVTLQESELSEAVWLTKDEIPENDSRISIAYEMAEYVRNYIIH